MYVRVFVCLSVCTLVWACACIHLCVLVFACVCFRVCTCVRGVFIGVSGWFVGICVSVCFCDFVYVRVFF